MKKDLKQRYRTLERLGCTIDWGRHQVIIEHPDGRRWSSPTKAHNFHVLRHLDKEIERLRGMNSGDS